jgi:drug/metabolite transporter (DMT)-like permease
MSSRASGAAYLALAAVCLFWGTTYLGIRMALESFPPAILIALRYFLSGGILLIAARLRGAHIPRGRELRNTIISGIFVIGIGNGALSWAELIVPSGLASLIITVSPFWFIIFEALVPGGVKPHGPTIFGMVVGFAGACILFLPGAGATSVNIQTLTGFAILQLGCVAWCLGSIFQRRQATEAHPIVTGAVQQLASSLAFVPLALVLPHGPIVIKARAVWAVAYLVVFGSIIGYSAYAYTIARLPVAIASIYPYVNSVVAVALGWVFYREPFGMREFLAMVVIFLGVGIVKWQSARAELRSKATAVA